MSAGTDFETLLASASRDAGARPIQPAVPREEHGPLSAEMLRVSRFPMRSVFLFFGFIGFTVVALAGFTAGRDPGLVLRDASIGCLVSALVGRWFWGVLIGAIREAVRSRITPGPVPLSGSPATAPAVRPSGGRPTAATVGAPSAPPRPMQPSTKAR